MIDDLLSDLSISFWLKNALTSALERDAVDALNDAELLVVVLKNRLDHIFGGYQHEVD